MRKLFTADSIYDIAIPRRTIAIFDSRKFFNLAIFTMPNISITEKEKAIMDMMDMPNSVLLTPSIMATLIPNSAADDMPKKYGSTSGLRKIVCMMRPAIASMLPTAAAAKNLGSLIWMITLRDNASPFPVNTLNTVFSGVLMSPTERDSRNMTAKIKIKGINKNFSLLLVVSIQDFV